MFKKRVLRPKTPPNLVPDDRFSIPENDDPDEDYDERITGYSTKRWRWFTPDKNVKLMRLPDMTEKMSLTEKREEPVYHTVFLSKPVMWADSGEMNFSKRPLPTARRGWELDKAKQFTLEEMRRANDEQAELVTKGGTDLYIPRPIQPAKEQAKIPRERFLGTGFAEDKLDYRRIAPTGENYFPEK